MAVDAGVGLLIRGRPFLLSSTGRGWIFCPMERARLRQGGEAGYVPHAGRSVSALAIGADVAATGSISGTMLWPASATTRSRKRSEMPSRIATAITATTLTALKQRCHDSRSNRTGKQTSIAAGGTIGAK